MVKSLFITLITFVLSIVAAGALVFTQTAGDTVSPVAAGHGLVTNATTK